MFVNGLGTAHPPNRFTKAECWDAFRDSNWFRRLDHRSHRIAETVLFSDNGIESRYLAIESLHDVFRIDPDTLQQRFQAHAPALAASAAARALANAGVDVAAIDGVVVSTCTGYLCPGLSTYVAERLGLRPDVQAFDLVGQGCGAALPNWRMAEALLDSGQCAEVLCVCVEVSSAAMYLDNDPGVLVSACLFGDGAGAAVLSRRPGAGRRIEWKSCASLTDPAEREALRFEQRGGMLRNILTRRVPRLAAEHALRVMETVLERADVEVSRIRAWILHAGGRDVLAALQSRLGLDPRDLRYSARMLSIYGNLSSAFVYFVLEEALRADAPGGLWWMSAFGAGFSCHGALLEVAPCTP
jgi:alkylresorcinol/alkylpyrone synthase